MLANHPLLWCLAAATLLTISPACGDAVAGAEDSGGPPADAIGGDGADAVDLSGDNDGRPDADGSDSQGDADRSEIPSDDALDDAGLDAEPSELPDEDELGLDVPADDGGEVDTPGDDEVGAADAEPDVPSCDSPLPFVAPGEATGWKNLSTKLFTVTQGGPNHRGLDLVVVEGAPQTLIGKFAYGPFDKDLKEEDVEIFVQDDAPCGPWVSYGVRQTSLEGQNATVYGIEDDGGRIFFTLDGDDALPVGRYPVRMLVHGDQSMAAFDLWVVEPGTQTVVTDIDGTLTTDDFELVKELFDDIFNGTYVPTMREGALDVMSAWAERGYLVFYLTGRPDFLKPMTRQSLIDAGFPAGPMRLTDTNGQVLPIDSGVGDFKKAAIGQLYQIGQLDIVAAYGNATTDIYGYDQAGISKYDTYIVGTHAGEAGTVGLDGYPSHLPMVESAPPAEIPAPKPGGWL